MTQQHLLEYIDKVDTYNVIFCPDERLVFIARWTGEIVDSLSIEEYEKLTGQEMKHDYRRFEHRQNPREFGGGC